MHSTLISALLIFILSSQHKLFQRGVLWPTYVLAQIWVNREQDTCQDTVFGSIEQDTCQDTVFGSIEQDKCQDIWVNRTG